MSKSKFDIKSLLSNASLNAGNMEGKPENLDIVHISVHDLVPAKENFYSVEDINDLKDSIEMFGIKQNLTVKQMDDGKYEVIAGHRRRLASIALVEEGKLGFEFVPCAVETELGEIKKELLLITTNSTARQLTDWERIYQADKMKELLKEYKKKENLPGRIRDLVAKALDTSPSQIGRMDSISNKLSDDFKEELKGQNINISTAYEISTLSEAVQQEIYEDYRENGEISIKDVKEKKSEAKLINCNQEDMPATNNDNENFEKNDRIVNKDMNLMESPYTTVYEGIKEMNISKMAQFICSRCDGIGRFCDYAFECNQANMSQRHEICTKWLNMQAQRKE